MLSQAGELCHRLGASFLPVFHSNTERDDYRANLLSIGYAGRCSSLVVSGTPVQRPIGQYWEDTAAAMKGENMNIIYGPCKNMDFELELGAIIGKPVGQGESVTAHDAGGHIFGFVIVNDWSGACLLSLTAVASVD